jgi:hypothetical protein
MVVAVGRITPNSSELTVIEGVLAMAKKETPTVPSVLIEQVEKPIPVTPPVIPPVKK